MPQYADEFDLERRVKAEWERNAAIRAEFSSFETFLAYERAVARGQVKVWRGTPPVSTAPATRPEPQASAPATRQSPLPGAADYYKARHETSVARASIWL